ncbi:MAG: hypothetical protein SGARI_001906 [Bacillariaceae sp.]
MLLWGVNHLSVFPGINTQGSTTIDEGSIDDILTAKPLIVLEYFNTSISGKSAVSALMKLDPREKDWFVLDDLSKPVFFQEFSVLRDALKDAELARNRLKLTAVLPAHTPSPGDGGGDDDDDDDDPPAPGDEEDDDDPPAPGDEEDDDDQIKFSNILNHSVNNGHCSILVEWEGCNPSWVAVEDFGKVDCGNSGTLLALENYYKEKALFSDPEWKKQLEEYEDFAEAEEKKSQALEMVEKHNEDVMFWNDAIRPIRHKGERHLVMFLGKL